jgi:hypothetical protein
MEFTSRPRSARRITDIDVMAAEVLKALAEELNGGARTRP